MFKNVGSKIQTLAKIICWLGIILFVLCGVVMLYAGINVTDYNYISSGVILLIVGPISCWASSLALVGFGKLVQDNSEMKDKINELSATVEKLSNK